jgi:predicted glycogen debranching enzyme
MRATVEFGRDVSGNLEAAESREWLVTNGIGGFASGTLAGSTTRRYHGLLVAALRPPLGRTQTVVCFDEVVRQDGGKFALTTHRWASGAVVPNGFQHIRDFRLEGTTPVWTYEFAGTVLQKRVWMQPGANTTFVRYDLLHGAGPVELVLQAMVNYRDFHASTHAADWRMGIERVEGGVKILAFAGAQPFYLRCAEASCEARHEWYRDFFLAAERQRGLDDREDYLFAAEFSARLEVGGSVTVVATTEEQAADGEIVRVQRAAEETRLVRAWSARNQQTTVEPPEWVPQLVLAADQFIVKRALPEEPEGRSVIAGYH